MDPHPTPFPGKRRPVPAPAAAAVKTAAPKPKSIAAARTARMAKKSPTENAYAGPKPRTTRRAFGTERTGNAPVEKPRPKLQKQLKVSPPPPQKPAKVSPPPAQKHSKLSPPAQKPAKVSPPPLQKQTKLSPPAMQKPSKLSPPNLVRATKPSKPVAAKPLKKTVPGADAEAKAKKRSQRVTFQVPAVEAVAPGSGEKGKAASADDAAGHTPMVATKAAQKPGKVVAPETPFFSAQNCGNCTLDQLESAAYWLAQIRLAEFVGKHWVAAAFFRLAFECQAQPIHRLQSELRNYSVRHDSAGTLAPLFNELLTAHGMLVNQPKFDTDGFEKVDTPLTTNVVDKMLDLGTLKEDESLKRDCDDDPIDVGVVIVDKPGEESMDNQTFEKMLDKSLEFDDLDAVIVGRVEETNFDKQNDFDKKVPCSSGIVQQECISLIERSSPRGSKVHKDPSGRLSFDNSFDKKSPMSSKRLTSSCPVSKTSSWVRDQSSKQMPSGIHSDRELEANVKVAGGQSKDTQDMGCEQPSLLDQFESIGPVEDSVSTEVH